MALAAAAMEVEEATAATEVAMGWAGMVAVDREAAMVAAGTEAEREEVD